MDRLTRKITEAMNLMKLMKWDQALQVGTPVMVCWTNSGRFYRVPGKVVRLNRESVKSELSEPVAAPAYLGDLYKDGRPIYPAGQVITCPRPTMGGVIGRWSWNNTVLPLDTSIISESELKELRRGN